MDLARQSVALLERGELRATCSETRPLDREADERAYRVEQIELPTRELAPVAARDVENAELAVVGVERDAGVELQLVLPLDELLEPGAPDDVDVGGTAKVAGPIRS